MTHAGEVAPWVVTSVSLVVALVGYVFFTLPICLISKKTRVGSPILAFVPLLNVFLMFRLADLSLLWILGLFVPLLNIVAFALVWMGIAKRCRKDPILGILVFIPVIGWLVPWYLAFSD